ncbi:unnamed protein product, partial [Symbiodinium pilosum]
MQQQQQYMLMQQQQMGMFNHMMMMGAMMGPMMGQIIAPAAPADGTSILSGVNPSTLPDPAMSLGKVVDEDDDVPPGPSTNINHPNYRPPDSEQIPGVTDRRWEGRIKMWFDDKGYGFITNEELKKRFKDLDVFLHQNQKRHFRRGDLVTFSVYANYRGTDSWSCEPDYALYVLPRCGEVVVVKAYEVVNSGRLHEKESLFGIQLSQGLEHRCIEKTHAAKTDNSQQELVANRFEMPLVQSHGLERFRTELFLEQTVMNEYFKSFPSLMAPPPPLKHFEGYAGSFARHTGGIKDQALAISLRDALTERVTAPLTHPGSPW